VLAGPAKDLLDAHFTKLSCVELAAGANTTSFVRTLQLGSVF
jgi:hypothetical protein